MTVAENLAPPQGPIEFHQVGQSPFDGLGFGQVSDSHSVAFADLDGDGDLDAIVGEGGGTLRYFENVGLAERSGVCRADRQPTIRLTGSCSAPSGWR